MSEVVQKLIPNESCVKVLGHVLILCWMLLDWLFGRVLVYAQSDTYSHKLVNNYIAYCSDRNRPFKPWWYNKCCTIPALHILWSIWWLPSTSYGRTVQYFINEFLVRSIAGIHLLVKLIRQRQSRLKKFNSLHIT